MQWLTQRSSNCSVCSRNPENAVGLFTNSVIPAERARSRMRAGISTVLIPKLNEKDLVEIPEEAKQKLKFVPVETVDEVLANALDRTSSDQHPS